MTIGLFSGLVSLVGGRGGQNGSQVEDPIPVWLDPTSDSEEEEEEEEEEPSEELEVSEEAEELEELEELEDEEAVDEAEVGTD